MSDKVFIDSNVLVYAYDKRSGAKHVCAVEHLSDLWNERRGVLSTQVLQEFYVNVTQKCSSPLSSREAKEIIKNYRLWKTIVNDCESIIDAIDLQKRYKISFWDALIIQAALKGGCSILLTEDLNDGQFYENLQVINPFVLRNGD